jgi:hypothetical protein
LYVRDEFFDEERVSAAALEQRRDGLGICAALEERFDEMRC